MLDPNGDKIIYSKSLDFYQYRTLVKDPSTGTWEESILERGPLIDRAKNRLFIVTGISNMYLGESNHTIP